MTEQALAPAPQPAVITPHPITLDGQRFEELRVGETVREFLERVATDTKAEDWEVRINGHLVPSEHYGRVRPKAGALIEARGIVKRQVLAIVAIAVLAYFTMGASLAFSGGALGIAAAGGAGAMATFINAAVYFVGPALGGRMTR